MSNIVLVSATKLEHFDQKIFGLPINIIGIGKVESSYNISEIITKKKPTVIINFGSCGNLKNQKAGEIIEVGSVYNDFSAKGIYSYPKISLGKSKIKCFTTDIFYDKGEDYHNSFHKMLGNCDIVDMELYSIAFICKKKNIELHSFKWVSDDGNIDAWKYNSAIGYENFKSFFKLWLLENNYPCF